MAGIREVGVEDFEGAVLLATGPVVVDFYGTHCPPCRALAPVLDALAAAFAGRVTIVKVNVDEGGDLAERYAVTAVPTLVAFSGGAEIDRRVGAAPRPALERWLGELN